jgi:hypothetical protein
MGTLIGTGAAGGWCWPERLRQLAFTVVARVLTRQGEDFPRWYQDVAANEFSAEPGSAGG